MNTEYLKSFAYGIMFGIPFCLALGPIFFLLIQAGVNRGIRYAMAIAMGVVVGDFVLIVATYYFVDTIRMFVQQYYSVIQITISILLLSMGLFALFKKPKKRPDSGLFRYTDTLLFFLHGFVLDIFNPSNVFVWIGVNSNILLYNDTQHLLFYTASLMTIALLMAGIALLSKRIEPLLNQAMQRKISIGMGVVYIAFAVGLIAGARYLKPLL